jgi:hypothetical protein
VWLLADWRLHPGLIRVLNEIAVGLLLSATGRDSFSFAPMIIYISYPDARTAD